MARVTYHGGPLRAYINSLPRRADRAAERVAGRGEVLVAQQIVAVGAVDTGELLGSVEHRRERLMRWLVFVAAAHGIYVNYGTWKMPARPFWEQAWARLAQEVPELVKGEFQP